MIKSKVTDDKNVGMKDASIKKCFEVKLVVQVVD